MNADNHNRLLCCCCCRKYHILRYEPITNSQLLHHGVAYSCDAKAAAAVKAMKSLGPFDRCADDGGDGAAAKLINLVDYCHPWLMEICGCLAVKAAAV